MQARSSIPAVLGIAFALGGVSPMAVAGECSLALVLAMDASKSMNSADFELAFGGTADALRSAEVQAAIFAQTLPVVLIAFEWSGRHHQTIVHDWSVLRSRVDIEEFAVSLERHERGGIGQRTGTGSALQFAYDLLEEGPDCIQKTVDVASDGYSSDGMTPTEFYAGTRTAEVTVNALVIGGDSRPYLRAYFDGEVLHGPGAFSLSTVDYQDFTRAMQKKFLRELSPPRLSGAFEQHFPMR